MARRFFMVVVSGYLALVLIGAVIAFVWIDDSEFLDPFGTSAWCESWIKGQTEASSIAYVWNCFDPGRFWGWAVALATYMAVLGAVIGLSIWAVTAFVMRLFRLNK
jgi:hypothetical protein